MRAARPLLYEWLSKEEVVELEGNAVREVEACENHMYSRVRVASGLRKM